MRGQWAWGPVGIRGSDVRRLVVWPPYETPLQFDLDKKGAGSSGSRGRPKGRTDGAKRSAYVLEDICDPALPPPQRVTLAEAAPHHAARAVEAFGGDHRELRERRELRATGTGWRRSGWSSGRTRTLRC